MLSLLVWENAIKDDGGFIDVFELKNLSPLLSK